MRFMASRPKPSEVTVEPCVRLRSCGVARAIPSLAQIAAIALCSLKIGPPRGPAKTKPGASSPAIKGRAAAGSQTRWLAPFLVPGQMSAMGSPGICHQPSTTCSRLILATSPGRWPSNKIALSALALTGSMPSSACQNCGSSDADKTRSRLRVGLLSISLHGLAVARPSLIAQVKTAEIAALVWLATTGAVIFAIILLDVAARDRCHLQLAPAGQGETTDQGIALSPCLVVLLGVLLNVFAGEIGKRASPALSLLFAAG